MPLKSFSLLHSFASAVSKLVKTALEASEGNPLTYSQGRSRFPGQFQAFFLTVSVHKFQQHPSIQATSLFCVQKEVWLKPVKYQDTPTKFWFKCTLTHIWVLVFLISNTQILHCIIDIATCRGVFLLPGKQNISQATSLADVPGKWQQTFVKVEHRLQAHVFTSEIQN